MQALPPEGDRHAYHLFVIRLSPERGTPAREAVMQKLIQRRIGFSVHFIPLHPMAHYRGRWPTSPGALPVTERIADELLSLPLFPDMADGDVARVIDAVKEAFRGG
jgi:dTDP-4-amino-4,6-dideoxygalactose transaminase